MNAAPRRELRVIGLLDLTIGTLVPKDKPLAAGESFASARLIPVVSICGPGVERKDRSPGRSRSSSDLCRRPVKADAVRGQSCSSTLYFGDALDQSQLQRFDLGRAKIRPYKAERRAVCAALEPDRRRQRTSRRPGQLENLANQRLQPASIAANLKSSVERLDRNRIGVPGRADIPDQSNQIERAFAALRPTAAHRQPQQQELHLPRQPTAG